jgi:heme oxygenase
MPSTKACSAADPLAAMRAATRTLHAQAERSGFVRELLTGRATHSGYALWLRNLWPAYATLERALGAAPAGSPIAALADARMMRATALENDLAALAGAEWRQTLPELAAGAAYARRIDAAWGAGAPLLAAHAYVRYLGDLNGGRVLRDILRTKLGLPDATLCFYAFDADSAALETSYRAALCNASEGDPEAAAREAALAFQLNIALSEEVLAAAA